MDAELTSWLKGRRLAWACRESTMRVGLENVDGNHSRDLQAGCGAVGNLQRFRSLSFLNRSNVDFEGG